MTVSLWVFDLRAGIILLFFAFPTRGRAEVVALVVNLLCAGCRKQEADLETRAQQ